MDSSLTIMEYIATSTNVYNNVFGNTLKQIIKDYQKQINDYIMFSRNNELDNDEKIKLKFLISEEQKAIEIYNKYNIIPLVVPNYGR